MGSFSLCVENTTRDVQSLLVLHKVHPKVCIDVRRRLDLLIEKSYEQMDVLEPGYGESSYDICHAIAKQIVKQTLDVGVPKSELLAMERRMAEKEQTIFELKQQQEDSGKQLTHAQSVVREMRRAHEFMLQTYFREVLVLRHQVDDLKKKLLAGPLNAGGPGGGGGGGKLSGFPRAAGAGGGGGASRMVVTASPNAPAPEDSQISLSQLDTSHNVVDRMESPSENPDSQSFLNTPRKGDATNGTAAFEPPRGISKNPRNQRGSTTVSVRDRKGGVPAAPGVTPDSPQNAIFDYETYISLLKVSQEDYEAKYKALLAERGEMLKRHREARVKSMMDNKNSLEEAQFMIVELSKQLEASRAISLMSEYKLRMCTEPVKEDLHSLLNAVRMDVHHLQEEYGADIRRATAAVKEVQDRSDALLDFVLTYVQAVAQLVVVVYEDASAKSEEEMQQDPFTEIQHILPKFFTVSDNEKRVKPMIRLEEAAMGRRVVGMSAPGGGGLEDAAGGGGANPKRKKGNRKTKVSIADPSGGAKEEEDDAAAGGEEDVVTVTEPTNLYDAMAARFWGEHPVARNAQRGLSEFLALAMQLRARKGILLQQKDVQRGAKKPDASAPGGAGGRRRTRLNDLAVEDLQSRPSSGGRKGGKRRSISRGGGVDGELDAVELQDEYGLPPPGGVLQSMGLPPREKRGSRANIVVTEGREEGGRPTSSSGILSKPRREKSQESIGEDGGPEKKRRSPKKRTSGEDDAWTRTEDDSDGITHRTETEGYTTTSEGSGSGRGGDGGGSGRRQQQQRGQRSSGRRNDDEDEDDDMQERSPSMEAHIAVVDTSGLSGIYKKQVEMLQEHVQQLQLQLLEQHEKLVKYHNEKKERKAMMHSEDPGRSGSKPDSTRSSSSSSTMPPLPQLDYVSSGFSQQGTKGRRGKSSSKKKSDVLHFTESLGEEEDDDPMQVSGRNPSSPNEGYQKMLMLAMEKNKRRMRELEAEEKKKAELAQSRPPLHPYYQEGPPPGWRCPLCDGYFTMEEAIKALEKHPAPQTSFITRLKAGWLDRPVPGYPEFANCRELIRGLRQMRYKRVSTQTRWSVLSSRTEPLQISLFSDPNGHRQRAASNPLSSLGVASALRSRYQGIVDSLSAQITHLLRGLKLHVAAEEETIQLTTASVKQLDIMERIQGRRTRGALFKTPFLRKPLDRKIRIRKRRGNGEMDEEDDEEEEEEEEEYEYVVPQPKKSNWVLELGGQRLEASSYWTETLREEAKQREAKNARQRAHHRALKKRGMFQSPFGAVAGFCTGVQAGMMAPEAHRGPIHLDYDKDKDRYFISNEYGHAALDRPTTADQVADAAGPPPSMANHPAEAPSSQPYHMAQVLIPAPLSMLPAPYNELAFAAGSRGTTKSNGFVIFTDAEDAGQPRQQHRPTSSPGTREMMEAQRQRDLLRPVYMIPLDIPVERSEHAFHGYGHMRGNVVYIGATGGHGGEGGVLGEASDEDRSRPSSRHRGATPPPNFSSSGGVETEIEASRRARSARLPPLPSSLRMTAYGVLMTRDSAARIVSSYEPPIASRLATQQPPRVSRPMGEEQQMFRIQGLGGVDAELAAGGTRTSEEAEALLSPKSRVASALRRAKTQRAARLAEEQRQEDAIRRQRQAEWDSRLEIAEPIEKEKFFRLRLPKVSASTARAGELPDPQAAVKLQRKLATKDLVGQDKVKKPLIGGAGNNNINASTSSSPHHNSTHVSIQDSSSAGGGGEAGLEGGKACTPPRETRDNPAAAAAV